MVTAQNTLPPLPEIGRPDAFYTAAITQAEQQGDTHKRAALKVGRYISLALNPEINWEEKKRYFAHAIKHHCIPPSNNPNIRLFYEQLANMVREHAGAEALRLASQEDDMYAARVALGQDRVAIDNDAENFFLRLLGSGERRPDIFNEEDWAQMKLLRDQWI